MLEVSATSDWVDIFCFRINCFRELGFRLDCERLRDFTGRLVLNLRVLGLVIVTEESVLVIEASVD